MAILPLNAPAVSAQGQTSNLPTAAGKSIPIPVNDGAPDGSFVKLVPISKEDLRTAHTLEARAWRFEVDVTNNAQQRGIQDPKYQRILSARLILRTGSEEKRLNADDQIVQFQPSLPGTAKRTNWLVLLALMEDGKPLWAARVGGPVIQSGTTSGRWLVSLDTGALRTPPVHIDQQRPPILLDKGRLLLAELGEHPGAWPPSPEDLKSGSRTFLILQFEVSDLA
jgi:hypothetical protein